MFPNIVLLMLVAFPVLYFLPLNFIRFRWGLKNGLAPMPPEMRAEAEAGDRAALFVIHLALLLLVAFSMRGSPISLQEVGLSLNNWKLALGVGLLFSLPLVGLSELAISNVPPEIARKEAESRGPVSAWCGLILSGSFSTEIWRAFCIAILVRNGFSAWPSHSLHFSLRQYRYRSASQKPLEQWPLVVWRGFFSLIRVRC